MPDRVICGMKVSKPEPEAGQFWICCRDGKHETGKG